MLGSKSVRLLPAATASGKLGVVGATRAGNTGLRNSTLPGAPNCAGKFVGSTLRVSVRPWFPPQIESVLPSSRIVLIAYPARITVPLPRSQASGPLPSGTCHASPTEGENCLLRAEKPASPGAVALKTG